MNKLEVKAHILGQTFEFVVKDKNGRAFFEGIDKGIREYIQTDIHRVIRNGLNLPGRGEIYDDGSFKSVAIALSRHEKYETNLIGEVEPWPYQKGVIY